MKRIVSIVAAALMALTAWAQPSIRVEVHNIVELQERFNVGFVVEGENSPSDFQWEAGDDFTVVWGPQKGSSTSIQIIPVPPRPPIPISFRRVRPEPLPCPLQLPA